MHRQLILRSDMKLHLCVAIVGALGIASCAGPGAGAKDKMKAPGSMTSTTTDLREHQSSGTALATPTAGGPGKPKDVAKARDSTKDPGKPAPPSRSSGSESSTKGEMTKVPEGESKTTKAQADESKASETKQQKAKQQKAKQQKAKQQKAKKANKSEAKKANKSEAAVIAAGELGRDQPPQSDLRSPSKAECRESAKIDQRLFEHLKKTYCKACDAGLAVEPVQLKGRPSPPVRPLEAALVAKKGSRPDKLILYYWLPKGCDPCDALLPSIHAAFKKHDDVMIVPVLDAYEDEIAEMSAGIAEEFPKSLPNLIGIYRDAAPRKASVRKRSKGVPVTIVLSGQDFEKRDVYYGKKQTRFWKRLAGE